MAHEQKARRVKLLFAARAINRMAGGVERMIITIMNAMVVRGHEVELFTWDRDGAEAFFPMSPAIVWHKLNLGDPATKAGLGLRWKRALAVRTLVRRHRPDVVIAFQGGPFMALRLYCLGLGVPMIAAERNAPTLYDHTAGGDRARRIMFNAFRLARLLIVQCEAYRDLHPPFLHDRLVVIPNPVYPAPCEATPATPDPNGRFRLLSVGRLAYQKHYESLITAFSKLADRFLNWDLHIVGEGEDRRKLEAIISEKGLSGRAFLLGTFKDPSDCYLGAHLFCLPSRWEGFPNTLAEAFAHGLPAVGYAGCAGVNVLIENGQTGLLASGNGDPESLARSLAELMDDGEKRREMGAAARASMAPYAPDLVMDRWEDAIQMAGSPAIAA
jgi:GalNAc-alpha-(1->4)-GalNAc-alpha-(1->3)-diNAcBac-PP-undecaprenol alpha-1,4-N-acetyl-D-galactosaminyltransferase